MPLSEHEQRLLDQIERALYQEDPKFASTVRATDLRSHMRRRLRRAALVLVLGFALLLTGVVTQQYVVGIAGFARHGRRAAARHDELEAAWASPVSPTSTSPADPSDRGRRRRAPAAADASAPRAAAPAAA